MTIAVGIADPARAPEALRAALGLTLRGARVRIVWLVPRVPDRSLAMLAELGHDTDAPPSALDQADAVEVWS
jgi:hypothetical protein